VFGQVTVTVQNESGSPQQGVEVHVFQGYDDLGQSGISDEEGKASFMLSEGAYRFGVFSEWDITYFSSEDDACEIPGCSTATIIKPTLYPVTVNVTDANGEPASDYWVDAYRGSDFAGYFGFVEAGVAELSLPAGDYRFFIYNVDAEYYSWPVNHCSVPDCSNISYQLAENEVVTVTIVDSNNEPVEGIPVQAYSGNQYLGMEEISDEYGEVSFELPDGHGYRFRTTLLNEAVWSGEGDHCSLPGCTSVTFNLPRIGNVVVSVINAAGIALPDREVAVFTGGIDTGRRAVSDANGIVSFDLLEGGYRFRVIQDRHAFWNAASDSACSVPDCSAATIDLPYTDVTIDVLNNDDAPLADALVLAYDSEGYANVQGLSDANGQAILSLPAGSAYRFRVDLYGQSYWSGSENTCVLPDCTAQTVTIQVPQGQPAEQEITYSYDALSRLVAADYDSGVYFHYGYDAAGNRLEAAEKLAAEVDEVVNTYTYDAANRQTGANGVAYTWDANGNLLNDGQYTYHYDFANRLSAVEKGTYNASYAYNGLGDRVRQTANGVTTQYTLDLNSGLTQVLTENTPGEYGDETYLYGLARLAQVSAESTEYFVADALGSVRQLTDAGAAVTLQRSYTPYGEILRASGTGKTNYAFTGESFDPQTGLTYLRARYYSAGQGRFISQDTWAGDARQPLSYNRWAYGYDNPAMYVDPSGLKGILSWESFGGISGIDIGVGKRGKSFKLPLDTMELIKGNFGEAQDVIKFLVMPLVCTDSGLKRDNIIVAPNPNQYNDLVSGWVDYWMWRARQEQRDVFTKYLPYIGGALNPNLITAVAYQETKMGLYTTYAHFITADGNSQANVGGINAVSDWDHEQSGTSWGMIYIPYGCVDPLSLTINQEIGIVVREIMRILEGKVTVGLHYKFDRYDSIEEYSEEEVIDYLSNFESTSKGDPIWKASMGGYLPKDYKNKKGLIWSIYQRGYYSIDDGGPAHVVRTDQLARMGHSPAKPY
jgi:RHS repeat-associated protein